MPRPRERNEATTPLPTAVPCARGGGTTACLGCLRASSTIVPVPLLASHAPLCARPALVLFFPFRPVVAPHLLFSPPLRTRRTAARTRYPAPLPQHPSRTRRIPYTGITVLFFPSAFPALARPSLCSQKPPRNLRSSAPRASNRIAHTPFEVVHDSLRPCPAAKLSSSLPPIPCGAAYYARSRAVFVFGPVFPAPQPCPLISRG